jgi:hypothetical protein
MKRKLIASIIGIAASSAMVASSYGQGEVQFANYTSDPGSPSAPVTFGSGPLAGELVGSEFSAELLYQYAGMTGGTAGPVAGFDIAEDGTVSGGGNPAVAQFLGTDGNAGSFAGLFIFNGPALGSFVVIPGDPTGGPAVTFELYSFGTVNSVNYTGVSAPFTQVLSNPVGDLFNPSPTGALTPGAYLLPSSVVPTPEPTTLALGGLGAAALLALRRRK